MAMAMFRKNRQLVAHEPLEFKKQVVEVEDLMKFSVHFSGIYRVHLKRMNIAKAEDVNM